MTVEHPLELGTEKGLPGGRQEATHLITQYDLLSAECRYWYHPGHTNKESSGASLQCAQAAGIPRWERIRSGFEPGRAHRWRQ